MQKKKKKKDSNDFLHLEKTTTFHVVIICIKSVFNKNENNYYYNKFLQKASYKLPKNKFLYKIMLYCDRNGVSERIDVNKTSKSKECDICTIGIF